MEKTNMKRLLFALVLSLISIFGYADNLADSCIVVSCNSSKIMIGNRRAEVGLEFDDSLAIVDWSEASDQAAFRVDYFNGSKSETFLAAQFGEEKVILRSHASTKGFGGDEVVGETVVSDTLYFLDTLVIPRLRTTDNRIAAYAAVCSADEAGEQPRQQITVSKKGNAYLVPRSVIIKKTSAPLHLDILEKDLEKDWEYAVWRKLYVVPLPLKMD